MLCGKGSRKHQKGAGIRVIEHCGHELLQAKICPALRMVSEAVQFRLRFGLQSHPDHRGGHMGDGIQAVEGITLRGRYKGVLLQVQPSVGCVAIPLQRMGIGIQQVEDAGIVEFSRLEIQDAE